MTVAGLFFVSCAAVAALATAQCPGHGVSQSTYSCNDPLAGKAFMMKYFPVLTPEDECANDVCICPASGDVAEWNITQGRVYMQISPNDPFCAEASSGFGLYLVNASAHLTTGGMSTAEVEAHFTDKVGDMKTFDSFMDYTVVFATKGLQAYKDTFKKDGVP